MPLLKIGDFEKEISEETAVRIIDILRGCGTSKRTGIPGLDQWIVDGHNWSKQLLWSDMIDLWNQAQEVQRESIAKRFSKRMVNLKLSKDPLARIALAEVLHFIRTELQKTKDRQATEEGEGG